MKRGIDVAEREYEVRAGEMADLALEDWSA